MSSITRNELMARQRSTFRPSITMGHSHSGDQHTVKENNGIGRRASPGQTPITTPMKTRVLVVHDDALARFALARMIEQDERFEICAETVDAPTARELLAYHDPQIVVISLEL